MRDFCAAFTASPARGCIGDFVPDQGRRTPSHGRGPKPLKRRSTERYATPIAKCGSPHFSKWNARKFVFHLKRWFDGSVAKRNLKALPPFWLRTNPRRPATFWRRARRSATGVYHSSRWGMVETPFVAVRFFSTRRDPRASLVTASETRVGRSVPTSPPLAGVFPESTLSNRYWNLIVRLLPPFETSRCD